MQERQAIDKQITLRVTEALPKDVGRGIARIDPHEMEALGVEVGGVLKVLGKRETVARVLPTYPDIRGKGVVQITGSSERTPNLVWMRRSPCNRRPPVPPSP